MKRQYSVLFCCILVTRVKSSCDNIAQSLSLQTVLRRAVNGAGVNCEIARKLERGWQLCTTKVNKTRVSKTRVEALLSSWYWHFALLWMGGCGAFEIGIEHVPPSGSVSEVNWQATAETLQAEATRLNSIPLNASQAVDS